MLKPALRLAFVPSLYGFERGPVRVCASAELWEVPAEVRKARRGSNARLRGVASEGGRRRARTPR